MSSICCNIALNYEQIKKDLQRISKNKPFIDQYIWKEINFPSQRKDWEKFETNNEPIVLNISSQRHNS